jgi:hypothetical protein
MAIVGPGFGINKRTKQAVVALGPELVTNGADPITTTTGWTASTAGLTTGNGELRIAGSGGGLGRADQSIVTEAGATYQLELTASGTAGNRGVRLGTSAGGTQILLQNNLGGVHTRTFVAPGTTTWLSLLDLDSTAGAGNYAAFKNISIRKVL